MGGSDYPRARDEYIRRIWLRVLADTQPYNVLEKGERPHWPDSLPEPPFRVRYCPEDSKEWREGTCTWHDGPSVTIDGETFGAGRTIWLDAWWRESPTPAPDR